MCFGEWGGVVCVVPCFAVGRARALLLVLQRVGGGRLIPKELPIFLDSPMALEATALYRHHGRLLRVPAREVATLCDGVRMVATVQQSMRLSASRYPAIIISASGLAPGGAPLRPPHAGRPHDEQHQGRPAHPRWRPTAGACCTT